MANNAIIGARIKQVREEKGLTQEELANVLGLNKSTIQRYETAKIEKIKIPVIDAIAQMLDVNPEWLSDKTNTRLPYVIKAPPITKIAYSTAECSRVPLIGRVAAGYKCLAEEEITEYILTDNDILKDGYEYFWLEVKGDSMEPTIQDGDLVLVQEQDTLDSDCFAVIIVDNEDGLVKKVKIESGKIVLFSINPYYPPRTFEKNEMNRIRIVGKVIEIKRRLY